MTDLYDPHIITETDTPTGLKEAIEEVEAAEIEAADWEYFLEVALERDEY